MVVIKGGEIATVRVFPPEQPNRSGSIPGAVLVSEGLAPAVADPPGLFL